MSGAIATSLVKYKTLPTWTDATVPESFQAQHNTKQGTWGKITVELGQLQYDALNEAGDVLSTDIILPLFPHQISPAPLISPPPLLPKNCVTITVIGIS